jgi:hypothetical protein
MASKSGNRLLLKRLIAKVSLIIAVCTVCLVFGVLAIAVGNFLSLDGKCDFMMHFTKFKVHEVIVHRSTSDDGALRLYFQLRNAEGTQSSEFSFRDWEEDTKEWLGDMGFGMVSEDGPNSRLLWAWLWVRNAEGKPVDPTYLMEKSQFAKDLAKVPDAEGVTATRLVRADGIVMWRFNINDSKPGPDDFFGASDNFSESWLRELGYKPKDEVEGRREWLKVRLRNE